MIAPDLELGGTRWRARARDGGTKGDNQIENECEQKSKPELKLNLLLASVGAAALLRVLNWLF